MLEKLISCVLSAGLYFPPDARGWAGLGWAGKRNACLPTNGFSISSSCHLLVRVVVLGLCRYRYQTKALQPVKPDVPGVVLNGWGSV